MKILKSKIIALNRDDIDTDLIIPAEYLKKTDKAGLKDHLFENLRNMDKDFPFNLKNFSGAQILAAGENFGCGSSRVHAVWALKQWGIKAIVAKSFADIFYNNALKNNLLPIIAEKGFVDDIMEAVNNNDELSGEINLESQILNIPGVNKVIFEIDPYRKECILKDMDDMAYLLANKDKIDTFFKERKKELFFDITRL